MAQIPSRSRLNFYPRSPRGERLAAVPASTTPSKFLSTLPARGATGFDGSCKLIINLFLSTLPARGATTPERLAALEAEFLSTLPARGATELVSKAAAL